MRTIDFMILYPPMFFFLWARVDLYTPKILIQHFHTLKMFIIQFHTSNAWKQLIKQFRKIIEKNMNRPPILKKDVQTSDCSETETDK